MLGNARSKLFIDAADKMRFRDSLAKRIKQYNIRHNRHGHLFDGRLKSKLVDGDEYLLALSRYVHLNPVKVMKMRNKPLEEKLLYLQHYMWSSYAGYIDKNKQKKA